MAKASVLHRANAMKTQNEFDILLKLVMEANRNKLMVNLNQVSKITGWGANTVHLELESCGISVRPHGNKKEITAPQLVECMMKHRQSAIDNNTRRLYEREEVS